MAGFKAFNQLDRIEGPYRYLEIFNEIILHIAFTAFSSWQGNVHPANLERIHNEKNFPWAIGRIMLGSRRCRWLACLIYLIILAEMGFWMTSFCQ